ncbi:MAG TPA: methylaspartate mutase subunit E, partial [Clostridiaceae bacterium]|nr:methylaspartate mutase subunit E [Clostridiaceae bacterium]
MSELSSKKLSRDDFFAIREEVLAQWPTGQDVDFDEAVRFHRELPDTKVFSRALDD